MAGSPTWHCRSCGASFKHCLRPEVRLYDSQRPLATIPNLAIHMNRDVNKGVELNRQTDMLPLLGMGEDEDAFMQFLAKELGR